MTMNAFDTAAFTGSRVQQPSLSKPALTLSLPDKAHRDALFRRIDYNGNGMLSLAEIDRCVGELWPHFDHKPALMRAYRAADVDADGFIRRPEFRLLLKYVMYFNTLWDRFDQVDTDGGAYNCLCRYCCPGARTANATAPAYARADRRLNLAEFTAACGVVGHEMSPDQAEREFREIDENGGGVVLFEEFCRWCARKHVADDEFTEWEDETVAAPRRELPAVAVQLSPQYEHRLLLLFMRADVEKAGVLPMAVFDLLVRSSDRPLPQRPLTAAGCFLADTICFGRCCRRGREQTLARFFIRRTRGAAAFGRRCGWAV